MALAAGTRLGPYEILEPLGAGGMGEVYRARDPRLGRDVAVKVLAAELSASPVLRQRLEREAKVVSSLSHPHICTLYDVGRQGEADFLVMEYLEGETLADRLRKGRLPLEQALRYGSEIADALESAHRHGVIHRDLKPGNVMLTKSGAILLDFGLAKLREGEATEGIATDSELPTKERPLTEEGRIVGTYPYMAPEQLEGRPPDARTDIFALGAMLYEMVTGHRAFEGRSRASLIAAIMSSQPRSIEQFAPMSPPLLDRVVRRCLAKDPDERWQSAGDLAAELRWLGDGLREEGAFRPAARLSRLQWLAWALSIAAALALGALASWWQAGRSAPRPAASAAPLPVTHTVVELPPEVPLSLGRSRPQQGFDTQAVALSPDGSQIVYVADSGEGRSLYLRPLESDEVRPIPGTDDAIHPFFSADGRWVGFLTTDKVKKVPLRGGTPQTLCEARLPVRATWTRDDVIYFAEREGASLRRVPAGGGEPADVSPGVRGSWNQVLPDGRSVLLTRARPEKGRGGDYQDIYVVNLVSGESRPLVEFGYDARYVPSGHIIFARSGNLMAVPFDLGRLEVEGDPVPVVLNVSMQSIFPQMQVATSERGVVIYVSGGDSSLGRLAWVDRQGDTEVLPVPDRVYGTVDLAPGGQRLAVHVFDVTDYIWIYDISRNEGRKLTAPGNAGWPVWAPDGKAIAFTSWQSGERKIAKQSVDGSEPVAELVPAVLAWSWSPDGHTLALATPEGSRFFSLDGLPSQQWQATGASGWRMRAFSANGRWVAYVSTETGRSEVWVRSYPDGKTARQISVQGGLEPVWCEKCGELFYRAGTRWMSSTVAFHPQLTWTPPRLAFETEFVDTPGISYDVSPDGQRLLVVKSTHPPDPTKLHVIQNWFQDLETKVPKAKR